jgi:hypothetical protein
MVCETTSIELKAGFIVDRIRFHVTFRSLSARRIPAEHIHSGLDAFTWHSGKGQRAGRVPGAGFRRFRERRGGGAGAGDFRSRCLSGAAASSATGRRAARRKGTLRGTRRARAHEAGPCPRQPNPAPACR